MSKQLVSGVVSVAAMTLLEIKSTYRREQKIEFYCSQCGKVVQRGVAGIKNLLCHECNLKNTFIQNYGTECSLHSPEISKKVKETMVERYGVEYPAQNKDVMNKMVSTCLQRFGNEHYSSTPEYIDKVHATCLKRYGVTHHSKLQSEKDKKVETCRAHYGVDYSILDPDVKAKTKETCLRRYNVPYAVMLSTDCHVGKFSFERNGIRFDSKWEMYYYDYLVANNICFEYQPDIRYEYYCNGKKHYYYPDFIVEGQITEVKGDQFFKENGQAQCPYNHEKDEQFQAKLELMLSLGVKILRQKDLRNLGIKC